MLSLTRPRARAIAAASVVAMSLGSALAVAPSAGAAAVDGSAFVAQINSLRAARGVAPVATIGQLTSLAIGWASHLAATGVLAHNPGLTAGEPPGWTIVAENVGMGSTEGAIQSSFAASPEHYDNMVNPRLTEVGVGVVSGGGALWVVEDYWGGPAAPAPPPPPPATPSVTLLAHSVGSSGPPAASASGGTSAARPVAGWVASAGSRSGSTGSAPPTSVVGGATPTTTEPVDLSAVANQLQYFDAWD